MRNLVLLLVLLLAGCASAQQPGMTGSAAGATPEPRKSAAKTESPESQESQQSVPVEAEQPESGDASLPKPKEYYIEED
jgi:hypothetical protein